MFKLLLILFCRISQRLLTWTGTLSQGWRGWFVRAGIPEQDSAVAAVCCDTIGWSLEECIRARPRRGDVNPGASLIGMSPGVPDWIASERLQEWGVLTVQSSPAVVLTRSQVNSDPPPRQAMFLWNVAWQGGGHVLSSL